MSEKAEKYEKYRNPDPRCQYPFEPDIFGYCWTWATYTDGLKRARRSPIGEICAGCEYWKAAK